MAKTFSSKSPCCLRQHWWAVQPRHDCQLCCGVTAGILLLSNTHAEICAHTHSRSKCSPGHAHKQALFLSSMNTITHIHTHSLVSNPQKLHITKKRRASCHRPALRQERARERERERATHTRHRDAKSEALLLIHVSAKNGKPVGVKTLSLGVFSWQ